MKKIKKRRKKVLPSRCQFCGKKVRGDEDVIAVGAKAGPSLDITGKGGKVVEMVSPSTGKNFKCVVSMLGSDAEREGRELVFVFCSETCARDFKEELYEHKDLVRGLVILMSSPQETGYVIRK